MTVKGFYHLRDSWYGHENLLLAMVHHSLIGYILHLISKGIEKRVSNRGNYDV